MKRTRMIFRIILSVVCSLALSFVFGVIPTRGAPSYTFTTINFPGANFTVAWGINNQGQIVGQYQDATGEHGFLLSAGSFSTIDRPGARRTLAFQINNSGQIVGEWDDDVTGHGFLLAGGSFSTIDVPGSSSTTARGINNVGDIVGEYSGGNGYLLAGGVFSTVDPPGASFTSIHGINDLRDIVGYFDNPGRHAFLFSGGSFTTIDFAGAVFTQGAEINEASPKTIVGNYHDATGREHGFLLAAGTFNTVDFPGATVTVTNILGINDSGQLVGFYDDATGRHGFLATLAPIEVQIDIKPGDFPNAVPDTDPLNLAAQGTVPVGIFTTSSFDAATVNASTALFAGASPTKSSLQDVDADGDLDLVLFFNTQDLNLTCADTQAILTGQTTSGDAIHGTDSIKVLKDKNGNKCP